MSISKPFIERPIATSLLMLESKRSGRDGDTADPNVTLRRTTIDEVIVKKSTEDSRHEGTKDTK